MRFLPSGRRLGTAALGLVLASSAALGAACDPPAPKSISGTIQGADGKIVDVMIGYDVIDAAGNKIDMGNLAQGYSVIQRMNHCVANAGETASRTCPGTGRVTGRNFSLKLPGNAVKVYIEVYPKDPNTVEWLNNYRGYTGPAAGNTDLSTYGMTFRRAIPVNGAVTNVSIVTPKVCGTAGGSTGTLAGHIANFGNGSIAVWSMSPDGTRSMGFGTGNITNGYYSIPALQGGQRYGVIASGARTINLVDYRRLTSDDTLVSSCQTRTFNF